MKKENIDNVIYSISDYLQLEDMEKPTELIDYDLSSRGGKLVIDASDLLSFKQTFDGEKTCGTYQNYLGGGLLGSVCFGSNFSKDDLLKSSYANYDYLVQSLKKLHHMLTNHSGDIWESQTYEQNQTMPVSAY